MERKHVSNRGPLLKEKGRFSEDRRHGFVTENALTVCENEDHDPLCPSVGEGVSSMLLMKTLLNLSLCLCIICLAGLAGHNAAASILTGPVTNGANGHLYYLLAAST